MELNPGSGNGNIISIYCPSGYNMCNFHDPDLLLRYLYGEGVRSQWLWKIYPPSSMYLLSFLYFTIKTRAVHEHGEIYGALENS